MSRYNILYGRGGGDQWPAGLRAGIEESAAVALALRDDHRNIRIDRNIRNRQARRIQRAWRRYDHVGPSASYIARNPREYSPSVYRPFGYHVVGERSRSVRRRIN